MATIKTPEQIAEDMIREHGYGGVSHFADVIAAAIRADRAQRATNGRAADPWAEGLTFDTTQVNRSKHARRSRSGRIKP